VEWATRNVILSSGRFLFSRFIGTHSLRGSITDIHIRVFVFLLDWIVFGPWISNSRNWFDYWTFFQINLRVFPMLTCLLERIPEIVV
jgi:uncharacterized membrane protein YjdF